MHKNIKLILGLMFLFGIGLTSCRPKVPEKTEEEIYQEELKTLKEDTKSLVNSFVDNSKYYDEELNQINNKKSEILSQIDKETKKENVSKLLEDFKSYVNGILTKEQKDLLSKKLKVSALKTSFIEGQYIEYTNFKVEYLEDNKYIETTEFSFDLEGKPLTKDIKTVTVTYKNESVTINITVLEEKDNIKGIDVLVEEGLIYDDTVNMSESTLYRIEYKDNSYSDYYVPTNDQIDVKVNYETITVNVNVELFGNNYTGTYLLDNKLEETRLITPNKTVYLVNESFDCTGANIEEIYHYGPSKVTSLENKDFDISQVDFKQTGTYSAFVTFNNVKYEFSISVKNEVSSIELVKELKDNYITTNSSKNDIAKLFEEKSLKIVYSNNSEEIIDVEPEFITFDKLELGENIIYINYQNKSIEVKFNVGLEGTRVKDAILLSANTKVSVSGVVVGFNTPGNSSASLTNRELIIKDPFSNDVIVINGEGIENYKKGQLVSVYGTIVVGTSSDKTRRSVSSENIKVLGETNDSKFIELDLSKAELVTSQEQFYNLFKDGVRENNIGKVITLHANVAFNHSYENIYRIYFPGVKETGDYLEKNKAGQYFNSTLSPTIKTIAFDLNCETDYISLFGDSKSWTLNGVGKDITVVYLGSTGVYYGDFVVLGDYCINTPKEILKEVSIASDTKKTYEYGEEFIIPTVNAIYYYANGTNDYAIKLDESEFNIDLGGFDGNKSGTYTITIKNKENSKIEFDISYIVEVSSQLQATSIEFYNYETIVVNEIEDVEKVSFDGIKIKKNYSNNTFDLIDVSKDNLTLSKDFFVDGGYITYRYTYTNDNLEAYADVRVNKVVNTLEEAMGFAKGSEVDFLEAVVVGIGGQGYNAAITGTSVGIVVSDGSKVCVIVPMSANNVTVAGRTMVTNAKGEIKTLSLGDKIIISNLKVNAVTGTSNSINLTADSSIVIMGSVDVSGDWFKPNEEDILISASNDTEMAQLMLNINSSTSTGGVITDRDLRKVVKLSGTVDNPLYIGSSSSSVNDLSFYYLNNDDENLTTVKSYLTSNGQNYYFSAYAYFGALGLGEDFVLNNTPINNFDAENATISLEKTTNDTLKTYAFVGDIYFVYINRWKTSSTHYMHMIALGCGNTLERIK